MIDLLRVLATTYSPLPAEVPPPSAFDLIRMQAMIHEESRRIHDLLAEQAMAPIARAAPEPVVESAVETAAPPAANEDELVDLLRRARLLLLRHPIAAQAAFAALIAEGRRFAATPEGAQWAAALAGSNLVKKGRQVWDAVTLNMLEDDPSTITPSVYLEALLSAARSTDLEGLLGRLNEPERGRA